MPDPEIKHCRFTPEESAEVENLAGASAPLTGELLAALGLGGPVEAMALMGAAVAIMKIGGHVTEDGYMKTCEWIWNNMQAEMGVCEECKKKMH